MKWMNFIPLLIWMLGFILVIDIDEHKRSLDGRGNFSEKQKEGQTALWWIFSFLFFVLGLYLSGMGE